MNRKNLEEFVTGYMRSKRDRIISKTDAEVMVDGVLAGIEEALERGEEVTLHGFGTFKVKKVAARMGRNPKTGESIKIAAKRKVKFTASKGLLGCP